jgi:hypothetical protein
MKCLSHESLPPKKTKATSFFDETLAETDDPTRLSPNFCAPTRMPAVVRALISLGWYTAASLIEATYATSRTVCDRHITLVF